MNANNEPNPTGPRSHGASSKKRTLLLRAGQEAIDDETPAGMEARMKKQATDSETPAETKARKDREKVARCRHRKRYEDQIKEIKKQCGAFRPVVTFIWSGDKIKGGWKEVTQLTHMANVSNNPGSGRSPQPFHGAIVKNGGMYNAVPSSHFKVCMTCVAKTGQHSTAISDSAIRLTGVCHRISANSTGYTLIQWCSTGVQVWLPANNVDDTKRSRVGSNPRFKPPDATTDILESHQKPRSLFPGARKREKWYAYFKPESNLNETQWANNVISHSTITNAAERATETDEEEVRNASELRTEAVMVMNCKTWCSLDFAKTLPYHQNNKIYNIDTLIRMANARWKSDQAMLMLGNPWMAISQPETPPDPHTVELSLTYDIIRGNILGTLGAAVDKSLMVVHDTTITNTMTYVHLISDIVQQRTLANHKMAKNRKGKGWDVVCSVKDCNSRVHAMFWKDKFCYKHGPKEHLMCRSCEKRHASRASGLCRACTPKFEGFCYVCKVQKATSARRRCASCVAHKKFEDKKEEK